MSNITEIAKPGSPAWRAYWQRRKNAAQLQTHLDAHGRQLPRVPYGTAVQEQRSTCPDCGVALGQLHVFTCCHERCPVCDDQAAYCCTLPEGSE